MRYLSVCSGIEAATVAWHPLGWQPVAFSEVDKFPSAVLAHHYPDVPNYCDMTKFQEWPDADVDLLVGGTPCQSFSVAGLRAGLDDPRGNLMLVYLALARRTRPRWLVWENVPGVLSSNGGRDFGTFLGGLAELGYGFAYRVLDAQYFGLAQRRKRVFVVGCLGDWRRAAAVLFERQSLSGHPAPRREAGQVAPTVPSRRTTGGGLGTDFDCDGEVIAAEVDSALETTCHDYSRADGFNMIAHSLKADGFDASEDGTGRGTPLVPVGFYENQGSHGGGQQVDLAPTLKGGKNSNFAAVAFDASEDGTGRGTPLVPVLSSTRQATDGGMDSDRVGPLVPMAFDARQSDVLQYGDKIGPLDTDGHTMGILQPLGIQGFVDTIVAYANATEADADKVLSLLREVADSPEGARRRLGELAPFWTEEILRSHLLREGTRREAEHLDGLGNDASPREEIGASGEMRNLQDEEGRRRSPSRRQSHQQRQGQSSEGVPLLSYAASSGADCVLNMQSTGEGSRLLQQAFDSLEEIRRPADGARQTRMQVRRLTPVECSRLQGFPDDYLDIIYRGKPAADGNKYKALGNSMAVPVMHWIGKRIQQVEDFR